MVLHYMDLVVQSFDQHCKRKRNIYFSQSVCIFYGQGVQKCKCIGYKT